MDLPDGAHDIVNPEVRAHINSLVSALGGSSTEDDNLYQLGYDALQVLRDIKGWLRSYDERENQMDVARCVYEANLVQGDLIPILAKWPQDSDSSENKFLSRIALSCLELLVPLTWPIDQDREKMTAHHYQHIPVLELAQLQYKSAIINFDSVQLLQVAVRTALPSIDTPIGQRTARDRGIIKLVLFFLRNMAMIAPLPDVKFDGDELFVSRSTTIDAFSYQGILALLLAIASNMGQDFKAEDTTVMEILYHLVKQVDVEKLFMDVSQLNKTKAGELSLLMKKEANMLQSVNKKAPTRHTRFGTMVWVKRDDGKLTSLSGQDALADAAARNKKMDDSKLFRPPRRNKKGDEAEKDLGLPTTLTPSAAKQLRSFVQDFLDSGFNPLFVQIRKSIDREESHLMQYHKRQFLYLISWFLEAERVRRKRKRDKAKCKQSTADQVSSFNLVAGVLNQEMFVTLRKSLHESYDNKEWHTLSAAMRCFTRILLTIQEMTEDGTEDDKEIAGNVLSRLFYEESTHDVIVNIVKFYKDQGFEYLDAATELVHHFLRVLEAYSKQNVDMQIRSKKRARKRKKANKKQQNGVDDDDNDKEEEDDDSEQDEAAAEKTCKELRFDFDRFASKFIPQGVVDTFHAFVKYYPDLNDAQLKRAHRYFFRLAFKQDMSVMVFRVDILHTLASMVHGTATLDKSSRMFKDWETLIQKIFRKCIKKIQDRPELIVEMLFSKLSATAFFLEHGYEKQTLAGKRQSRPAAELVFKRDAADQERDQQIAIAVGCLLEKNETHHIEWLKKVLTTAESERRSWSSANEERSTKETSSEDVQMADLPRETSSEDAPMAQLPRETPSQDTQRADLPQQQQQQQQQQPKLPPVFVVRPDSEERRSAMFKNPHLRLLMKLASIRLLGPASEETPKSMWVIPAETTASQLHDTLHFIGQAEFSPPTFADGASAEQQLKRKTAPRKKAAFDDDDDADARIDDFLDDGGLLFPAGGPTARKVDGGDGPKKAKRARKRQRDAEKEDGEEEEEEDAEREERARRRRDKEREKARRIKSALYVRDGDDDFDEEEDAAFFARERATKARAEQAAANSAMRGRDKDDGMAVVEDGGRIKKRKKKRTSEALLEDTASSAADEDEDEDGDEDDGGSGGGGGGGGASETDDTLVDGIETATTRSKRRRRLSIESQDGDGVDLHLDDADADAVPFPPAAAEPEDAADADAAPSSPARRARVRGGLVVDSDDD